MHKSFIFSKFFKTFQSVSGNIHVNHDEKLVFCSHCCENVDKILKLSPPTPQKFCHNFDWVLHIFICSDLPKVMVNVGEQVNKTVNEFLSSHGFSARDEAQQRLLVGQITEMSSKDNRVYKLLCKLCSFQDSGPHYFSLVILIQSKVTPL